MQPFHRFLQRFYGFGLYDAPASVLFCNTNPLCQIDENLNVCDFNRLVADAYMETVERTLLAACKINAPLLNMHMNQGVYITLPDKKVRLFAEYRSEYMAAIRRFLHNATASSKFLFSINVGIPKSISFTVRNKFAQPAKKHNDIRRTSPDAIIIRGIMSIDIIPCQQEIKRECNEHLISPDMVTKESLTREKTTRGKQK